MPKIPDFDSNPCFRFAVPTDPHESLRPLSRPHAYPHVAIARSYVLIHIFEFDVRLVDLPALKALKRSELCTGMLDKGLYNRDGRRTWSRATHKVVHVIELGGRWNIAHTNWELVATAAGGPSLIAG